jgi:hypothetical protein
LAVAWVIDVEVGLTVVSVEAGLTVVDVGGVAVGVELEQAAARTASPTKTMCLAFIKPPRLQT